MTLHTHSHLTRLRTELIRRINRLSDLIDSDSNRGDAKKRVDGVAIRLAIGDANSILKEIGKLR